MFELYAITDRDMLRQRGKNEVEAGREAYAGGADVVQLRLKNTDGGEMLSVAKQMQKAADEYSKIFIVNDRVDVAVLAGADGVHLGQSDIPVKEARKLTGPDMIIGVSVDTPEEARQAVADGADYVAVGAIFPTATKKNAKQGVGLDSVFLIKQAVKVPVVAIGGINRGNMTEVFRAGADSVAVVSAIMAQPDIRKATHDMKDIILKLGL
ncbi:MAG: thiamine phosphate synthase [Candidatus Methanomethylophilus sp.]|nr:thiamine phosphate synthase [Methanomethylophilus sp.]MDD4669250.1 thiamine phosphate synthase [Methanomethylophilus sp.]